ncbi:MAG TPA: divalent-cation tolerance protein CutA [Bryobacteraceae bacterium]|jgi:periplasmic divalent cation tolerance protein
MTDKIVVLSACDSEEQAARLARHLVELRLAACVNIVPGARSVYRWKGAIEDTAEWLLVIKSRRDLFSAIRGELAKMHTYEVPELLAMPVVEGSENYLAWMDRELVPEDDAD